VARSCKALLHQEHIILTGQLKTVQSYQYQTQLLREMTTRDNQQSVVDMIYRRLHSGTSNAGHGEVLDGRPTTRELRSSCSDVLSSGNSRWAPAESRRWPDICHSRWNLQSAFQPARNIQHRHILSELICRQCFVCLFAWDLTALSAQIGYITP